MIQGKFSNYDTDLFQPILAAIGGLAGTRYGADATADVSMRVVADHLRATVVPDGRRRGAVERVARLRAAQDHAPRDAARQAARACTSRSCTGWLTRSSPRWATPTRSWSRSHANGRADRARRRGALRHGAHRGPARSSRSCSIAATVRRRGRCPATRCSGSTIRSGVPLDFIEDSAERAAVDHRSRRLRSRDGARSASAPAPAARFDQKKSRRVLLRRRTPSGSASSRRPTRFDGYTDHRRRAAHASSRVFDAGRAPGREPWPRANTGFVVTDRTPFYLEAGGQVSDTGTARAPSGRAQRRWAWSRRVSPGGPRAHQVQRRDAAVIEPGDAVTLAVDAARRDAIRRNHTALTCCTRRCAQVLGTHVKQAGSLVAPDRLRFDFVQPSPFAATISRESSASSTTRSSPTCRSTTEVKATADAIAAGAMALFGEKYGDTVRVVSIPGLQPRAVRRHPLRGDRRHRPVCDHRRERRRSRRPPRRGRHRHRRLRALPIDAGHARRRAPRAQRRRRRRRSSRSSACRPT